MKVLVIGATGQTGRHAVKQLAWGSGGAAVPPVNPIARYFVFPVVLRYILADKRRGEGACSTAR